MGRNGNNTMPYLTRAETHSALVINPTPDNKGQAFEVNSEMIKSESKERGAYMVYDLTGIYGEWVNDYKRGFLVSDERNTLTVRDEVSLKGQSDLRWNMITKAEIKISADGKSAVLTQNGKKLKVTGYSNAPEWKFEIAEDLAPTGGWQEESFTVDEQKKFASGARKLVLSAKAGGKVDIAVKLAPMVDGEEYSPVENVPFSGWQIPDGTIPPKPQADAIYADGKLIDGFLPGIKTYNISCTYGSTIPNFTANASLGTVEVKQASSFADNATVTVSFNDGKKAEYNIFFNVTERITDAIEEATPQKTLPAGMKLLDIINVRSDHEPQSNNPAVNVADGDFNTYWASDEKGTFVEVDLGQVYDLAGIAMSFMDGDTRNYKYDLLISEDKMDYKRIYSGFSHSGTLEYEFLPANVKARYVRYVGFQHKTGKWNSISEVRPVISE
ncbi:MAG: discoidin domain-containing protein [Clostridia bacterium]|nr:discoidin domain-containing protein [Clostridia bacterium]